MKPPPTPPDPGVPATDHLRLELAALDALLGQAPLDAGTQRPPDSGAGSAPDDPSPTLPSTPR